MMKITQMLGLAIIGVLDVIIFLLEKVKFKDKLDFEKKYQR